MSEQERLRQLVAEKLGLDAQELTEDVELHNLEWDSLDLLELLVAVELEFDISLSGQRLSRCETLGEAAELIAAARRG